MGVYIFNIVFIILAYYVSFFLKTGQKFFLKSSFLYLFFISTFRSENMGTDYSQYVYSFYQSRKGTQYTFEKGFLLFQEVINHLTPNYLWMTIVINLIIFIPLYYYIKKCVDEKYWWVCVFIFTANPYMFIQCTFNIVRQTMALGIVIVGVIILLEKRNWKNLLIYIALICLARQFHRGTIVLLIVPFLVYVEWNAMLWLMGLVAALVIRTIGLSNIILFVSGILRFNVGYAVAEDSSLNHPIYILVILCLCFYILYRYRDLTRGSRRDKSFIDMYLFSLCFLMIALTNEEVYRIYIMLAILSLPAVPILFGRDEKKQVTGLYIVGEKKLLVFLYVTYYLAFYIGYINHLRLIGDWCYYPFEFMWNWTSHNLIY